MIFREDWRLPRSKKEIKVGMRARLRWPLSAVENKWDFKTGIVRSISPILQIQLDDSGYLLDCSDWKNIWFMPAPMSATSGISR